jgi:hypothetical protein
LPRVGRKSKRQCVLALMVSVGGVAANSDA